MGIIPIPNKCIWCLKKSPDVAFASESHVLPKCVGNKGQQVLPKGIVCDKCNNYFGSKIEPSLINDPIFHTVVGILQLRDKKNDFGFQRIQSEEIHRIANIATEVTPNEITAHIEYIIKGQLGKEDEVRNVSESKTYEKQELALFSRAIHKIAFESFAHSLFVKDTFKSVNIELMRNVEIFDDGYDPIRNWVRYQIPNDSVREMIRFQTLNEAKTLQEKYNWEVALYSYKQWMRCEMSIYNDHYIVSLNSPPNKVHVDLVGLLEQTSPKRPYFIMSDKIHFVS